MPARSGKPFDFWGAASGLAERVKKSTVELAREVRPAIALNTAAPAEEAPCHGGTSQPQGCSLKTSCSNVSCREERDALGEGS